MFSARGNLSVLLRKGVKIMTNTWCWGSTRANIESVAVQCVSGQSHIWRAVGLLFVSCQEPLTRSSIFHSSPVEFMFSVGRFLAEKQIDRLAAWIQLAGVAHGC